MSTTVPLPTSDSVISDSSPLQGITFSTTSSSGLLGGVVSAVGNQVGNIVSGASQSRTTSTSSSHFGTTSTFSSISSSLRSSPTTASVNSPNNQIHIIKPDIINYCQDVRFEWTAGAGPEYTYEVHGPNGPNHWLDTGSYQNFTIWNWLVMPGEQLTVSIKDRSGATDTRLYTVGGDGSVPCPTANPNPASGGTDLQPQGAPGQVDPCSVRPCEPKRVSSGAIAGISVGASAIVCAVGIAIWLLWRKKRGQPRRVVPLSQEDKEGDRASITTARSNQSMWSTFSGRNTQPNTSLEDGIRVETSTSQSIDDTSSPVTTLPSTTPLLTPSQNRGGWNRGPVMEKGRAVARQSPTSPTDEQSVLGSLQEDSVYSESINPPSTQEHAQSPFNDVHGAVIAAWNDMKLGPNSNTSSSESDARQLSPSELEALADMVAARLHQRMDHPSAPHSRDSHAPSEELPRYS